MRNFLLIVLTVWLVVPAGCSNKYESVSESAPPPALRFGKDTMLIREKDPTNINASGMGIVRIFCSPAGHQFNLSFSDPSGQLHFVYRGTTLKDSEPFVVTEDPNELYCWADQAGEYEVDFTLTDQLGRMTTRTMLIVCKPGERPLAALSWQQLSSDSTGYKFVFDGSHSAQPFGQIMEYHFLIDSDRFVTPYPQPHYIFHSTGQHIVSFHVVDDLGASSDTLTYTIDVQ